MNDNKTEYSPRCEACRDRGCDACIPEHDALIHTVKRLPGRVSEALEAYNEYNSRLCRIFNYEGEVVTRVLQGVDRYGDTIEQGVGIGENLALWALEELHVAYMSMYDSINPDHRAAVQAAIDEAIEDLADIDELEHGDTDEWKVSLEVGEWLDPDQDEEGY